MNRTEEIKLPRNIDAVCLKNAIAPEDYVGLDAIGRVLSGLIPIFGMDENDSTVFIDFPETAPKLTAVKRTLSRALLLTGASGTGKRTAEKYLGRLLFEYYSELFGSDEDAADSILYYKADASRLFSGKKDDAIAAIGSFFDRFTDTVRSVKDKIVCISFGDVTDVMSRKKTAVYFSKRMAELMNDEDIFCCIASCVYDGGANELADRVTAPFTVVNLNLPDHTARSSFFGLFRMRHSNIILETEPDRIADLTEGFTYRMLTRLAERIVMDAKGRLLYEKGYTPEEYAKFIVTPMGESIEKLTIGGMTLYGFIDEIRGMSYVPQNVAKPTPAPAPINVPIVKNIPPAEPAPDAAEEAPPAETKQAEPDTIAELMDAAHSLPRARDVVSFSGTE